MSFASDGPQGKGEEATLARGDERLDSSRQSLSGISDENANRRISTPEQMYHIYVDFVWKQLQRFGVKTKDIEDLMQDVFYIVCNQFDSYDQNKPAVAWLYGIAFNVASNHRRRAFHRRELGATDSELESFPDQNNPETDLEKKRHLHAIHIILDLLDAEKRSILLMFEYEGMSCEEIAQILSLPIGTVYSRIHYAREQFENYFRIYTEKGLQKMQEIASKKRKEDL